MTVRSFPFASLDAISKRDVEANARMRRIGRAYANLDGVAAAVGALVNEVVTIRVLAIKRFETRAEDDGLAVLVSVPREAAPARHLLVELDGALGARLVGRALDARAPRISDPSRVGSPALAGALAAVLLTALRKAPRGPALRAVAAGPAHALTRDLAATKLPLTTAWLTVRMGGEAFEARVSTADTAETLSETPSRELLERLGQTKLSLALVVGTCLASREDIASLVAGDAFVPPEFSPLAGRVVLIAPRSERGIGGDLGTGGRLVIRGPEELSWDAPMPESPESPDRQTASVLDAPVVVRVELGAVEMTARAWAELAHGDVVSLDRRLGDPAILRIAGAEVARGELVQVDGSYGVRILSRTKDSP